MPIIKYTLNLNILQIKLGIMSKKTLLFWFVLINYPYIMFIGDLHEKV